MTTPFIAVGDEELGEPTEIIRCEMCGGEHPIEYGTCRSSLGDGTWSDPAPSRLLGFYRCGDGVFLGTIKGRKLNTEPHRCEAIRDYAPPPLHNRP
jgi:hypothetical protein